MPTPWRTSVLRSPVPGRNSEGQQVGGAGQPIHLLVELTDGAQHVRVGWRGLLRRDLADFVSIRASARVTPSIGCAGLISPSLAMMSRKAASTWG